jgi:hypothetical protein
MILRSLSDLLLYMELFRELIHFVLHGEVTENDDNLFLRSFEEKENKECFDASPLLVQPIFYHSYNFHHLKTKLKYLMHLIQSNIQDMTSENMESTLKESVNIFYDIEDTLSRECDVWSQMEHQYRVLEEFNTKFTEYYRAQLNDLHKTMERVRKENFVNYLLLTNHGYSGYINLPLFEMRYKELKRDTYLYRLQSVLLSRNLPFHQVYELMKQSISHFKERMGYLKNVQSWNQHIDDSLSF